MKLSLIGTVVWLHKFNWYTQFFYLSHNILDFARPTSVHSLTSYDPGLKNGSLHSPGDQPGRRKQIQPVSQNLITLASSRSLASSTATMQLPEPLLDLNLVLELEGDLELKHTSPEGKSSTLNLDPEGFASMLYTE